MTSYPFGYHDGYMDTKCITETLAEKVEGARRRQGMPIQGLSDLAGIPYTTLHRQLKGHSDFSVPNIYLIAAALGEDPKEWASAAFESVAP